LTVDYSFKRTHNIKADILNISIDGLLMRTNHILDIDDLIELRFLNDGMLVHIMEGQVKFRIHNQVGIEFQNKIDNDEEYIKSVIKNCNYKKFMMG
jgi:hypothetical protein